MWFDAELSVRLHVSAVAQTCFYPVQSTRRDITVRLVTALVLSRMEYRNAVLAGLPTSTLAPFQQVLHTAACTMSFWILSRVTV